MDMNNIADIVVSYVDVEPINQAIATRAETLGEQMDPKAAQQFIDDMKAYKCKAESDGNSVSFKTEMSESYLINYLKNHGTPESGGEGGIVHDVDGSTYESSVPEHLQGTPLPWYELPVFDGEDEIHHIVEIMAQDAVQSAIPGSKQEISDSIVKPYIQEEIAQLLGG